MSTIDYLNVLREEFVRLADAADDGRQPAVRLRRFRAETQTARRAATAGLVATLCVGGLILLRTGGDGQPSARNSTGPRTEVPSSPAGGAFGALSAPLGHNPFVGGGRRASLREAISKAGYSLPIPDAPGANPAILSYVWIGPSGGKPSASTRPVALDYASTGIRLVIEPAQSAFAARPRQQLERDAHRLHLGHGAVQSIGRGLLLVERRGASGGPHVKLFVPGVAGWLEVEVIGFHHMAMARILGVVDSLVRKGR